MMQKMFNIFFITVSLFVSLIIPAQVVIAGDEDMMSPYTQFDPETGFFIPIDPQTQGHEPNSSNTTNNIAQPPVSQIVEEDLSSTSSTSQNQLMVVIGTIFLLIAGTAVYLRRVRNKSASNVNP
ncbi:MAG: hypothetical protein GTO60_03915 [Gammaproteobacteria bacterium]|nr:hypothetical protein [Gammaproteobacteria bacterium]